MIITVVGKGGVGKSLISSYLFTLFSNSLALDCDADNPSMHHWLGIEEWDTEVPLYLSEKAFEKEELHVSCPFGAIREGHVIKPLCHGCGVCKFLEPDKVEMRRTLTGWLRKKGNLISVKLKPGETGSGKLVHEMKKMASEIDHEIEIRDAPAGIGCATFSAIQGSDLLLIVVEPNLPSFQAMKNLKKLAREFGADYRVIINKWDLNKSFGEKIEKMEKVIGKIPYKREVFEASVRRELPKILENSFIEIKERVMEWWEGKGKG